MTRWIASSLGIFVLFLVTATGTFAQTGSTSGSTSTTSAFDSLSPGNQKIALALFNAQETDSTTEPLTLDQIAAKKQGGEGWGQVFHDMKAQGPVGEKNLGQIVSRSHRGSHGLVVTAGGRDFDDGSRHAGLKHERDDDDKSEHARFGKGRLSHRDDDSQGLAGSGLSSKSHSSTLDRDDAVQGATSSTWHAHGDYGASRNQTYSGQTYGGKDGWSGSGSTRVGARGGK